MLYIAFQYLLPSVLALYFGTLVYLLLRGVPVAQQGARRVALAATILWCIMLPVSLVMMFLSVMGSGSPHDQTWLVILIGFSLLLLFLLCLYSLTNVWMQYRLGDYKQMLFIALAPYGAIALFSIAVAIQMLY